MGIFDFLKPGSGIDAGVEKFRATPGAVLLDVRDRDEYAQGHIPGSVNAPLRALIDDIGDIAPKLATPIFAYCLSGRRSGQAAAVLKKMGYENAVSIGGISSYKGEIEK